LTRELICRDGFDEWMTVKPPIRVQQRTTLSDEVGVPQIKWTVEIPEVGVAEFFKDSEWVAHRTSCRRSAPAIAAISSGISLYWREPLLAPSYTGGDPEHRISARSTRKGGRQLAGIESIRPWAS
jgi:hypothetical protein